MMGGSISENNKEQPSKTSSPVTMMVGGSVTEMNNKQLKKAQVPILVTGFYILIYTHIRETVNDLLHNYNYIVPKPLREL